MLKVMSSQKPTHAIKQFKVKTKSKSLFGIKKWFRLPVKNAASPLIKGNKIMKPKSRRSFKALMIALVITLGGGYAVYRNMFMPKVQVQHVARQWLDNSAGKNIQVSSYRKPIRTAYRAKHGRPSRIMGCHIPRHHKATKHHLAKHSKKHKNKKHRLAHRSSGRNHMHQTTYRASN
jgi:hypothetical protein